MGGLGTLNVPLSTRLTCSVPLLRYMTMARSVRNHCFRKVAVGFQVALPGATAELADPLREVTPERAKERGF